ncbi:hypothetical protein KFU94_32370 [Chloroflexi bacterium TSY]|nr:hypothetical protein [Chloroflexi bacterium TSY]
MTVEFHLFKHLLKWALILYDPLSSIKTNQSLASNATMSVSQISEKLRRLRSMPSHYTQSGKILFLYTLSGKEFPVIDGISAGQLVSTLADRLKC